jgi:hypothetical protein
MPLPPELLAPVIQWGAPGVLCAVLLWWLKQTKDDYERRITGLTTALDAKEKALAECQASRLADMRDIGREVALAINNASRVIQENAAAQQRSAENTRDLSEAIRAIQAILQRRE